MGQIIVSECMSSKADDLVADSETVEGRPTLLSEPRATGPKVGNSAQVRGEETEIDGLQQQEVAEKRRQEADVKRLEEESFETKRRQAEEKARALKQAEEEAERHQREAECERAAQVERVKAEQDRAAAEATGRALEKERMEVAAAQKAVDGFLKARGFRQLGLPRKAMCGRPMYPFHLAVEENDSELVTAMLRCGADKDQKNSARMTPLEVAEKCNKNGSHELVLTALRSGAGEAEAPVGHLVIQAKVAPVSEDELANTDLAPSVGEADAPVEHSVIQEKVAPVAEDELQDERAEADCAPPTDVPCEASEHAGGPAIAEDVDPSSQTEKPKPDFSGEWKMVSVEGDFDAYMKEAGVGYVLRKAAGAMNYGVNNTVHAIRATDEDMTIENRTFKGTFIKEFKINGCEQDDVDPLLKRPTKITPYWEDVAGRSTLALEAFAPIANGAPVKMALTRRYLEGASMVVEQTSPSGLVTRMFFSKMTDA